MQSRCIAAVSRAQKGVGLVTLSIGGVGIGGENPCRFIAEASNNHGGDPDRMKRIIRAAKDAGADFLKTQCYDADELVALRGDGPAPAQWGEAGWSMRDLYSKAATPMEWFDWIPSYCAEVGIVWFSSVFGQRSLEMLERAGCPAYKIARLDRHEAGLTAMVMSTSKPVLVSTEASPPGGSHSSVGWLYCPPGYPQDKFALAWKFNPDDSCGGPFDGFSYHGTDPRVPVAAATLGAKLIEVHFQLGHAFESRTPSCATYRGFSCDCNETSELEANISLDPISFRRMVDDVRAVEAMLA
jgi:pseudaminic acid synthase